MTTPATGRPVRLLMIDDSSIIRLGLRAVLEDCPDIVIVGEAGTAADGLAAVEKLKPDVVLLDMRLPDKSGLTVCQEIVRRRQATRVLILTSATDERNMHDAISAGAQGFLLKDSDGSTLVSAITRVAAGHSVIDPSLTDKVVNLMKRRPGQTAAEKIKLLSFQEQRVVALVATGLTNKEIGENLGLTEKTVKNYVATIFDKLGIARRAQAAALHVEADRGHLP
jgi:two-component system response regulator DevR